MWDISKLWKWAIWFVFGLVLAGILGFSGAVSVTMQWIFEFVPNMNRNISYIPWEARWIFLLAIVVSFWLVISSYIQ